MEYHNDEVKFVPVQIMKAYDGRVCVNPIILNPATNWRRVVSDTPLYPWVQECPC
jgi:hypothetical protein